jgi:hypothetical protein
MQAMTSAANSCPSPAMLHVHAVVSCWYSIGNLCWPQYLKHRSSYLFTWALKASGFLRGLLLLNLYEFQSLSQLHCPANARRNHAQGS